MFHEEPPQKQKFEDLVSSKTSFILGFVAGILTLGTIGFLILLVRLLS